MVTESSSSRASDGAEENPIGGLEAVLDATRSLFWIESPADASLAAHRLITDLGGATTPARIADSDALPIDAPGIEAWVAAQQQTAREAPQSRQQVEGVYQ